MGGGRNRVCAITNDSDHQEVSKLLRQVTIQDGDQFCYGVDDTRKRGELDYTHEILKGNNCSNVEVNENGSISCDVVNRHNGSRRSFEVAADGTIYVTRPPSPGFSDCGWQGRGNHGRCTLRYGNLDAAQVKTLREKISRKGVDYSPWNEALEKTDKKAERVGIRQLDGRWEAIYKTTAKKGTQETYFGIRQEIVQGEKECGFKAVPKVVKYLTNPIKEKPKDLTTAEEFEAAVRQLEKPICQIIKDFEGRLTPKECEDLLKKIR